MASTASKPITDDEMFRALAFNAFNYAVMGEDAFHAVVRVARQCAAWELVYGDLHDAVARLESEWPEVVSAAHARHAEASA